MRIAKPEFRPEAVSVGRRVFSVAVLGVVLVALQAQAQSPGLDAPTPLKTSRALQEAIPVALRSALPVFVTGERISARPDIDMIAEGQAVLRRGDLVIRADRLEYYQPEDQARARGGVQINRAGEVFEGPALNLRLESFEGFFLQPRYRFLANGGHGEADRVDFIDEQRSVVLNASFTTCRRLPGPSWMPDWVLRAASISVDNEEEVGQASGAVLSFKGVPLLPVPSLSFPLSSKRKSGFLPPSIGVDTVNGFELTEPYYWNIAPNRDATLFPALMSKRGVDLAGEFRYLESAYGGQMRANYMPDDKLRGTTRWGLALAHQGSLDSGLTAVGNLGASLALNRVSDANYWRDFTRVNPWLTQRLLPNDMALTWANASFSAQLRTLKWQTLQDVLAPIVPPYDRLPQLALRYNRSDATGLDVSVDADATQFSSDRALTGQANGRRIFTALQLSRPWLSPAGFITPKIQVHATQYQLDSPLSSGATMASRLLPTFSLDSGLVFERDASFFGRKFLQTLEPRALLVQTPYRDQSALPNYDSGANDFNFASIFLPNSFVGNDRISDGKLLTLGLSTRLFDVDSGAEAMRLGVAQRLRFQDQRVVLPGSATLSEGRSDALVGATMNIAPHWSLDSTVQFDPDAARSTRSTVSGRYNPGNYRSLSAAYRLQRGLSEQVDISWQWPVNDAWGDRGEELGAGRGQGEGRWYSVGRMNYSLREAKLVDSILGLEYDGGCWLGRVVLERLQTGSASPARRIMFQLEFVGFSRLGANPLQALRQNIPRYQYLREATTEPSRFSNYD